MAKDFNVKTWMTTRLGLSGNELVAYAYLYDVTEGGKSTFEGGYSELSGVMGVTIPTVYNTLRKLAKKGLLQSTGGKTAELAVVPCRKN